MEKTERSGCPEMHRSDDNVAKVRKTVVQTK